MRYAAIFIPLLFGVAMLGFKSASLQNTPRYPCFFFFSRSIERAGSDLGMRLNFSQY